MDNRNQIAGQLKSILSENLELEVPDTLAESLLLYEDLNVDSIMMLQLVVYLEETFEVTVPEEEISPDTFKTVGLVIDYIEALQGAIAS
ncbi:phosphopantetheine-binding protein [Paenibacillus hexagrammi]|uniref:Phosphopantetheine-binding protein n=1 Tax=Paenibacillus hexagrammi TaxID=2908839 RepID=A0ABY3SEM5_9BACL|nr:phosphopantetheine-binding protein [Paenibacillus sp. YPD9-1]UJF31873.1 phosphopantetheine-binding protein [Paenibacillus sp. YPD9-1]